MIIVIMVMNLWFQVVYVSSRLLIVLFFDLIFFFF
jgi:hypothetical protein